MTYDQLADLVTRLLYLEKETAQIWSDVMAAYPLHDRRVAAAGALYRKVQSFRLAMDAAAERAETCQ